MQPNQPFSDLAIIEFRLLGTILETGQIPAGLEAKLFTDEERGLTFSAMVQCRKERQGIDQHIFADYLHRTANLDRSDWCAALAAESASMAPDLVPGYVSILRERASSRAVSETLWHYAGEKGDPDAIRAEAIKALRSIAPARQNEVHQAKDILGRLLDDIESRMDSDGLTGLPTSLPSLDRIIGGWQKSDLIILAARPAVGKTAMLLQMAFAAKARALFVSGEQPAIQVMQRLLSQVGHVPIHRLRNPRELSDDQWPAITAGTSRLKDAPIAILDNPAPHIQDIAARMESMSGEFDIVLVDYLQRIKGSGQGIYEKTTDVVQTLKELARTHDVPIICAAQINRQGQSNANMSHLKGSGDIEQEADQILILERDPDEETKAELSLEKNRHGPTGSIPLYFDAPHLTFAELAYQ